MFFIQESLAKEGKMCLEIIPSLQKTHPTSKVRIRDFCGGTMGKTLPATAGDMVWKDPWSGKIPYTAEQLSPRTTTTEPRL